MNSKSTSTLRRNHFKPLIFSTATRLAIVDEFLAQLGPHLQLWRAGQMSDLKFCGWYWTLLIRLLRPRDYKVGATPWAREAQERLEVATGLELWQTPLLFRMRSCPLATHAVFYKWQTGPANLVVTESVPSSFEVLALQCTGRRFVTLITDRNLFLSEVEGRDPFSFLLHDLVHADKFFADSLLSGQQVEYLTQLKWRYEQGEFNTFLQSASFKKKFEYLISDMNTHPEHMRLYLNHILLEAGTL